VEQYPPAFDRLHRLTKNFLDIHLQVPQLIENYRLQSAHGISLVFLSVWFVGDITNFLGSVWAGLVPTVTALAVYFCFADTVLILQCLYYNVLNARRDRKLSTLSSSMSGETEPLLARQNSVSSVQSNIGLPGSHRRRRSSAASGTSPRGHRDSGLSQNSLSQIVEDAEQENDGKAWLKNTISVLLVCLVGVSGWAIAWRTGVWRPAPEEDGSAGELKVALGAEILGYTSAVCYLGYVGHRDIREKTGFADLVIRARIPQIIKNQRDKSCEGLSLLFFILSLLGNATYGAGVCI
jgi:uncharacterized protein with PQ loop repeat